MEVTVEDRNKNYKWQGEENKKNLKNNFNQWYQRNSKR